MTAPVVAAASLAAALVHASIVGVHAHHVLLAAMFAGAAVVQGAYAALVLVRPTRRLLVAGACANAAFAGAWLLTRVVGVGFVDGVATPQPVDAKGLTAFACAVLVAAGSLSLRRDRGPGGVRAAGVAAGVVVLVVSLPLLTTAHGHEHDHDVVAAVEIDHADVAALPEGVTPEHRAFAEWIIEATNKSLPRWADVSQAQADGFRTVGDAITGFEHFVQREWYENANILDPDEPESLVYRVHPDGSRELVSAMYLLPLGSTMDEIPPEMDSPLTPWHFHDDLCFDGDGRIVAVSEDKQTCPRGVLRVTPPMIHVWIVDHPCGPFAGIERHGEACAHDHDAGAL